MAEDTPRIVVLLGASNLSFALTTAVEGVLRRCPGPCHILVACGAGRSYGLPRAGNPLHQFVGIARCDLWPLLARLKQAYPSAGVYALLTDLGNDLLYMRGDGPLRNWLERIFAALAGVDARVVATALPRAGVAGHGPWRFALLRRLFFPGSPVQPGDVLDWLDSIQAYLATRCAQEDLHLVPDRADWYGFDGFHLKWRRREEIFGAWLTQLLGEVCRERPPLKERRFRSLPRTRYWRLWRELSHPPDGFEICAEARLYLF